VRGEGLDFGEIVRGQQDGRFRRAIDDAFDELLADQHVEAAEWFIQHDQARWYASDAASAALTFMPRESARKRRSSGNSYWRINSAASAPSHDG